MYKFLSNLIDNFENIDIEEIFKDIIKKLTSANNVLISVSGNQAITEKLMNETKKIKFSTSDVVSCFEPKIKEAESKAMIIPAGVNYNAKGINLNDLDLIANGQLLIFRHIINFDYLWSRVRVMGGAYGCSLSVTGSDDLVCSSYRDPNVKTTYQAYDEIINYLENLEMSEDDFISYLIGAIGKSNAPLSTNSLINMADGNYIRKITDEERLNLKKEMINTTINDLKELLPIFKKLRESKNYYTVGNETKIKEYKFDKIDTL